MRAFTFVTFALGMTIPSVGFGWDDKPDKELIQGRWKVVSSKDGGKDDPSEGLILCFKNGKLTAKRSDEVKGEGSYTLDPRKNPKWIDVKTGDSTFLGIYELKGDTLKICHGKPGDKRSTKFASEAGSPNKVLTVLKREKN